MTEKTFSILTLGYGYRLIDIIWNRVATRTDIQISHIPNPSLFPSDKQLGSGNINAGNLFYLFDTPLKALAKADLDYLLELEGGEGSTIHNVILGDRRLSALPYQEALDYISVAARRFEEIFLKVKPQVVLSGFESFHSTLGMMICRKMGIPWFGLVYAPMPRGMTGFSSSNNSKETRSFGPENPLLVRDLADRTLMDFETGVTAAYVPESENSIQNILKHVPLRFNNAVTKCKSLITGRYDRYTHRPFVESVRDYLRRRWNYFSNQRLKLLESPPSTPYVFFGFHMQPEMGIDVWAPFFSNQPYVIECIARAVPLTHKVLIKLHKIDSDNWSNAQLSRIAKMPGVVLVSADADTQNFIRRADIVFSIQGTITLEAALLGRPVISFGETMYEDLATVTRVGRLIDLPRLVRSKLQEPSLTRSDILAGLEKLLSRFRCGLYQNWEIEPTNEQLNNFCHHLDHLRQFIQNSKRSNL